MIVPANINSISRFFIENHIYERTSKRFNKKGYTRNDICKLLKISKGHFNRIREELSIKLKPTPSKEELEELYIRENLSLKKLSKVLNIPKNRIVRILARFNIKKSPDSI